MELLVSLLICLLTSMVFLQVLFRYAFDTPLGWSEEFVMFLFQWGSYLGAALAVKKGFHFHLDLLLSRLPRQARTVLGVLASACILATGYVMIHYGIGMMKMNSATSYPILRFSVAYGYLAIPSSGAFIILYQLRILYGQITESVRR